ncbi:FdtA/QdtA family cupin domain-containing protein [Gammaproteobacteria bacterium]|jgi:hypothetical protein|nr:FdtA/QdtA family cupin domain-containing protein [Gammaproteobacteria bacterium]
MAYFVDVPRFNDSRGSLCVLERVIPFDIKRIYYIFDVSGERGGHRHKETIQALICLSGCCQVYVDNGEEQKTYMLDQPEKCLILEPKDWHTMDGFSQNASLLVLASEYYDAADYIDEAY